MNLFFNDTYSLPFLGYIFFVCAQLRIVFAKASIHALYANLCQIFGFAQKVTREKKCIHSRREAGEGFAINLTPEVASDIRKSFHLMDDTA